MSFQKIYEILCDECFTLLKHGYSVQECKDIIKNDKEWTAYENNHYCSKYCLDAVKAKERELKEFKSKLRKKAL